MTRKVTVFLAQSGSASTIQLPSGSLGSGSQWTGQFSGVPTAFEFASFAISGSLTGSTTVSGSVWFQAQEEASQVYFNIMNLYSWTDALGNAIPGGPGAGLTNPVYIQNVANTGSVLVFTGSQGFAYGTQISGSVFPWMRVRFVGATYGQPNMTVWPIMMCGTTEGNPVR